MEGRAVSTRTVTRVENGKISAAEEDRLAIEEPLEIRLQPAGGIPKSVSVTMRTPGHDAELALGFLFTEGIVPEGSAVLAAGHEHFNPNKILVQLAEGVAVSLKQAERNFYTTSSCGVCGKSAIEAIRTVSSFADLSDAAAVSAETLCRLPGLLRAAQQVFESTGGLHASGLFSTGGELLLLREDVGRHNALDKLIGAALRDGLLPLNNHILLLSGRASFELLQKASMAGIRLVAAVGAPSSLAVQLAEEAGITLAGFLRGSRFNVYTHPQRISL